METILFLSFLTIARLGIPVLALLLLGALVERSRTANT